MKTIATIAAALVAAATLTATPGGAVEPVRVMVVGDSVTQGSDGDYTWRYFAAKGLEQTGASFDFVGPYSGTYSQDRGTWGGSYGDPDFDSDHASRWGQAMVEPWLWPSPQAPLIGDLVAQSDPDVVVEQMGLNDFAWLGSSSDDMLDSIRRFVSEAQAAKPGVDVVLGTIPQTWIRHADAFNAALPGLASDLSTEDSRVVSTPVADFVNGVDTYDPAHPTTQGQRKLAQAVSVALEKLGLGQAVLMPLPSLPGPHDPVEPNPGPVEPGPVEPEPGPVEPGPVEPEPGPVEPDPGPVEPDPGPVEPEPEVVVPPEIIAPPVEVHIPPPSVPAPIVAPAPSAIESAAVLPGKPRRVHATQVGSRSRVRVVWSAGRAAERYEVRCGRARRTASRRKVTLWSDARSCSVRSVNDAGASGRVRVRVR